MFAEVKKFSSRLKRKAAVHLSVARSAKMMHRLDKKTIIPDPNEIRLFTMARNESLRLPYFLDYYFSRGVDRIFLIDNGSTDNTASIAMQRDNVHVFHTNESFRNYFYWMEVLLRKFGAGHWCVAVDLDEFFIYPHSEHISIPEFISFLEQHNYTAVYCLLLDMYADSVFNTIAYKMGENPLDYTPYFDPDIEMDQRALYDVKFKRTFQTIRFSGGMRQRVFGIDPNLTKVPLFKNTQQTYTAAGMHAIEGANVANLRGAVLHFKYLQDFKARAIEEAAREQHAAGAFLYKSMAEKLQDNMTDFHFKGSKKYESSDQLVNIGLITTNSEFETFYTNLLSQKG